MPGVTPPVECGLLAGTMRAELLEAGTITERRIAVEELRAASQLWLVNSVHGWVEAAFTGGPTPKAVARTAVEQR